MPTPARATGPLRELPPDRFGVREARHLLWRAGFGGAPSQVELLASWGLRKSVDHLMDLRGIAYERPGEEKFDATLMTPPSAAERQQLNRALQARDEDTVARFRARRQQAEAADRQQVRAMQRWWLARMIETPKPLEEKMALFWHGHFATSYRTIENSWHMLAQNRLFREHATGNFGDLLRAIVRDPAMLAYLDNNRSRAESPNENLARELMELFSLGVGGYSEEDIKEGARALTGHTFEGNDFVFRREWHDAGRKAILGKEGALDADGFVEAILARPRCAEFLALKLQRFFLEDLPADPRDLSPEQRAYAQALASTIRAARYDLAPALRALFLSERFYDPAFLNGLIKSPAQLVVGMVRSLRAPTRDLSILADALELMGQDLFFPPSVAGWPGARTWINTSTLFVRQNTAVFLLTGRTASGDAGASERDRFDPEHLIAGLSPQDRASPERVAGRLLEAVLGPPPSGGTWDGSSRQAELVSFARPLGVPSSREALIGQLALITSLPEHQLC